MSLWGLLWFFLIQPSDTLLFLRVTKVFATYYCSAHYDFGTGTFHTFVTKHRKREGGLHMLSSCKTLNQVILQFLRLHGEI